MIESAFGASVITNANGQIREFESSSQATRTSVIFPRRHLQVAPTLVQRQTPVDDVPKSVVPGAGSAPKDTQPKLPDLKPLPTPVLPGPGQPKMPIPVAPSGPAKLSISKRQAPKGGPTVNDDDPVLPKIPKQPHVPGVPQPKIPVPTETERPIPLTFTKNVNVKAARVIESPAGVPKVPAIRVHDGEMIAEAPFALTRVVKTT